MHSEASDITPSVGSSVKRIDRDAPKKHSFVQALEAQQSSSTEQNTPPAPPTYNFDNTARFWSGMKLI
jgi:hypothetical protein